MFEVNWQIYGLRKIWWQLGHEGVDVARCTMARLMKSMGIQGMITGKPHRTTIPDKRAPSPLDKVNRQFRVPAPNMLWGGEGHPPDERFHLCRDMEGVLSGQPSGRWRADPHPSSSTPARKGIGRLSAQAQDVLRQKPTGGALFAFRGRKGDRLKLLYWDCQAFCLYYTIIERGRFPLPNAGRGRCDDLGAVGDSLRGHRLAVAGSEHAADVRSVIYQAEKPCF